MIYLHTASAVQTCVDHLYTKDAYSSGDSTDDTDDQLNEYESGALSLLVAAACASSELTCSPEAMDISFAPKPQPKSRPQPQAPVNRYNGVVDSADRAVNEIKSILSHVVIEDLVSEDRFGMLGEKQQQQLLRLLPEVDSTEDGDSKLSESALTNKYVADACRIVQEQFTGQPVASRETYPREAKKKRKRFFRNRRESESSKMSTASEDYSYRYGGDASFSSDAASSSDLSNPDLLHPLQCLAKAAAEVTPVTLPLAAMPASLATVASGFTTSSIPSTRLTHLSNPVTLSTTSASVAAASPGVAASCPTTSTIYKRSGPILKHTAALSTDRADTQPTRKKRGAGKKLTRAEQLAHTGSSARTQGLKKGDISCLPARMTGWSQLCKLPQNAKVGHLRSRYSTIPLATPIDSNVPENIEGDAYVVMSTGFDHDYSGCAKDSSAHSLIPVLSRGYASEHDYSRSPSSWTPMAGGRAAASKRRSLGDLSALPGITLSPLLNIPGPTAITLPAPIEPLTIEDANVASQISNRPPSSDLLQQERSAADMASGLSTLSSSYNSALSLIAATANIATAAAPPAHPAPPLSPLPAVERPS